jgi:uncharacterized protein (DUF1499 family)
VRLAPAVLVAAAMTLPPLAPCAPRARNCVSTESDVPRQAMPAVPFADAPEAAQARARAALLAEPRTTIVREGPGYLKAESRSRLLGFVDDVEIVVDGAARVFRFRSASRVGRGDLGVNRRRMERVSARLRGA